jgi:tetratricopeptide (TPR) repeat protein
MPTPLDWMLRGQVELAYEHTEEALAALARVPDGHPMASQARLMAGQIELRRHRARIAEQLFREALRLDPGLVQAHRELIYILGYQLRRVELNAEFEALSRYAELGFDNVFHWCLLRTAQWDPASAIDELARFIEAEPEDRSSRLALAENYRRLGLSREAEDVIAPLPPDDPEALACRVMLMMDRHQEDEAEQLLRSAPADHPSLARLRGRIALSHRDGPTAVRCFRLAEASDPGNRDTIFGLINALTLIGDERAAAPFREMARHIDELNSLMERVSAPAARTKIELLRDLGSANAVVGRIPEARAWYRLALAVEPLDPQAQQALFQLESQSKGTSTAGGESPVPG